MKTKSHRRGHRGPRTFHVTNPHLRDRHRAADGDTLDLLDKLIAAEASPFDEDDRDALAKLSPAKLQALADTLGVEDDEDDEDEATDTSDLAPQDMKALRAVVKKAASQALAAHARPAAPHRNAPDLIACEADEAEAMMYGIYGHARRSGGDAAVERQQSAERYAVDCHDMLLNRAAHLEANCACDATDDEVEAMSTELTNLNVRRELRKEARR